MSSLSSQSPPEVEMRGAARAVPGGGGRGVLPVSPHPWDGDGGAADPLGSVEYVVVDVETTGGSAKRDHRVTEIAAIRVSGTGVVLEEFATLIDPERAIPPFITALTGITTEMVRGAPRFLAVAGEVRRLLDGRIFVAHNVAFDWRFVARELERAGEEPVEGRRLCTVRLARRVVPELGSRSLGALTDYFGIENEARHRALGDARATVGVLRRLLERAEAQGVRSWAELQALIERRPPRRKRRAGPTAIDRI